MPKITGRKFRTIEKTIYRNLPNDNMVAEVEKRENALEDVERKAYRVLKELNGRRGYRQLWEDIENDDPEICEEIFRAIKAVIANG